MSVRAAWILRFSPFKTCPTLSSLLEKAAVLLLFLPPLLGDFGASSLPDQCLTLSLGIPFPSFQGGHRTILNAFLNFSPSSGCVDGGNRFISLVFLPSLLSIYGLQYLGLLP